MFSIIPNNSKLILGISGGPDSVYLLYKLIKFSKKKNLTLHIAHFNHNTRGLESDHDQKFVEKIAKKNKLNISVGAIHELPQKNMSEANLRQHRYDFLEKIRQSQNADFIVTAHHQDDQVETIIFNFFRGTGPAGLTGMKEKQGNILRPLLNISKKQILAYLTKNKIKYCLDSSNQNTNYNRNLIRHEILPLIKKINLNSSESILNLAQIITSQQNFINQVTQQEFKNILISAQIPIQNWLIIFNNPSTLDTYNLKLDTYPILALSLTKFKLLPPAIQTNLIKIILTPFVPKNKQLKFKTVIEIVDILNFSQGGSQKILYDTLSISKKNDKIYLHVLDN